LFARPRYPHARRPETVHHHDDQFVSEPERRRHRGRVQPDGVQPPRRPRPTASFRVRRRCRGRAPGRLQRRPAAGALPSGGLRLGGAATAAQVLRYAQQAGDHAGTAEPQETRSATAARPVHQSPERSARRYL